MRLEKCQFLDFLNLFFYSLKRCFFVLEYRKRHFLGLYCLKKKVGKMGQPWVNPFGKMSIFRVFVLLFFYSLERRFLVLKYRKGHFPMLQCQKKKVAEMPIFGPKPWVNHFEKMSIFRLFEPLIFIAQKGVFSFQNIVKDILLPYIA